MVPEIPFEVPIVSVVGDGGNRTLLCAYFLCSYMDRVDKTLRAPAIGHSVFREISSCESYRCGQAQ